MCNRCRPPSTRLPAAKAQSAPVQVKITVQRHNHTLQPPSIDTVSPTTMTSGHGFSEAAVVRIGGLGGALVAWELSVMLVKLLTGVLDPAPSVIAVSVGYVDVAVLALVAALMAAALASAHTSARLAVEELCEL